MNHQTGRRTERPHGRFETPPEKFPQIPVVVQVLHCCLLLAKGEKAPTSCFLQKGETQSWRITDPGVYLHVDPKGPDVHGVDGLPEPVRQVHVIETTPGPREQTSGEGAVERHLQEQTQTRTSK